ncbi:MAG: ABC transporter substrate-binding protein [Actinobacteria bacterium]|nr:MAG: ABC transporter substrate-binding protein [Actinomycetota bacterium]
MRRALAFAVLVGVGATVWAGFGTAGDKTVRSASDTTSVTISNEQGTTWTCGFSPFNGDVNSLSFGPVYEELVFVNGLKSGATTNWLASSYKWGNGNKTLTFTIRSGVKWTDGKPFSADDVVFTYQLLRKNPGLDLNADWAVLKSVSKKGNKVVFNFKTSAVPYFYYIAAQTPIVAKHIWSSIKNPVTYKETHPVGTGPFKMSSCSPQVIKYTKNSGYWQKGLPKIDTIYYPAFTSNDPANQQLASGKAQWGSQFIPNIKAYYSSKSSNNHYWFPPLVNVNIFINLKDPILSNVAVRRAIAYAIDRGKVSRIGEYSYEPASNQTGIVTPTFSSWLDKGLASKITYNPAKAVSILQKAGFKRSGGVFHTKSGKPLSFRIINIGGYSDWVASVQVIQQQLKAVGIKIKPENLSSTTFDSNAYNGKFQLMYNGNESGGPAPYYELRQLLYSKNSAPIGKTASSNWERYYNSAVDKLIEQYGATTDSAKQHAIVKKLEAAMVNDVPVIPVTEGVDWYQYNTKSITGWVTQSDPYAKPAAYEIPDWGVLAMHLRPK